MISIKNTFSEDIAKKIISNKDNAQKYLLKLNEIKAIDNLKIRINRNNKKIIDLTTDQIWKLVVDTWDYNISKEIIREIFKQTDKYKNGKEANKAMDILITEWESLKLGKISWPFSQGAFDNFVQSINSEKTSGLIKDEKVKLAAVKYRRIKEINTVRNDFIETLIFEKNKNIIPTLKHSRGVDFFINGESYDQKVAKSPTREFIKDYHSDWKKTAIENPNLVAKYLYEKQDEGRFGAEPRLLIVYLDEDVSIEKIKNTIKNTNLANPISINFTYKHENLGEKNYKVSCFIILFYN